MMVRLVMCSWLLTLGMAHAQNSYLVRYPDLSPNGQSLAFSWQGDIWLMDMEGEEGIRRMTVKESYESHPRWSEDGERLVFSSNRYGNADIMELSVATGNIKQLTYHSASDQEPSFDGQGNVYFSTRRTYRQLERESEIYILPQGGATPYRYLNALGFEPNVSPDGRFIAFVKGGCRVSREQYRGPANRDIYLYNVDKKTYTQLTKDEGMDVQPRWTKDNELYFLSARSGKYNIHRMSIDKQGKASGITAVTKFTDDGIRNFTVSADGSAIVVEHQDGLKMVNPKNGRAKALEIELPEDSHFYNREFTSLDQSIQDFSISPNEKYVALSAKGEIFVIKNDDNNPRSNRLTHHQWKDYSPIWTSDTTLSFLSDRTGVEDLYSLSSADTSQSSLFHSYQMDIVNQSNSPDRELGIYPSPDLKKIALLKGTGHLVVYDVDSTGRWSSPITLLDGWSPPTGITWSPDSRWLAYSQKDLYFNAEIFIQAADGSGEPINVSMHPRGDSNPVWSKDGRKLAFKSNRNNGDDDIWFVWLQKENWEKSKQEWKEEKYDDVDFKKSSQSGSSKSLSDSVYIDVDKIYRRLVQVTSLPGDESNIIIDNSGETIYFNGHSEGKLRFFSIKWDGSELKTVLPSPVYRSQLSSNGKSLYYISRGKLMTLNLDSKKAKNIPFSASINIDREEERAQVFEELWRVLNDRFYDPQFHGQNWQGLKEKYKPWAMAASTQQDFRDMVNDMLGQLNSSHMGLYGDNPEKVKAISTGKIGIEVMPTKEGIEISHVVPLSPADREESALKVGDRILAVNGVEVSPQENFWIHWMETTEQKIWLKIERDGQSMDIYIRPQKSMAKELYEEWVEERRALTDKYSKGRLGYIHIQGMNWTSFEAFERELTASGYGKEGLVIDVRYNGGGWTTDMLMTVLTVQQHAYTVPRGASDNLKNHEKYANYYPYGERLPLSAWTLPAAAICNHSSYSNAEIFSHAFKNLGRGPLIGEPTFGAVISTSGTSLMDGSYVRLPFRGWFVKKTGDNMEGSPAVPDYVVYNPPGQKAEGEDDQLKKAVEVLLSEMDGK
ncbi:S41 family peptidase [Membranihabitans marinus]|uniref:S41 family peptidase n=1 Tax=Membranihabitans marinus TaxID=1227546 RepID=UPI001F031F4D|nr:S41 family peptidase [Membranihabitans marinus]